MFTYIKKQIEDGKFREAKSILFRMAHTTPNNYRIYFYLALCEVDPNKVNLCLNKMLEINPTTKDLADAVRRKKGLEEVSQNSHIIYEVTPTNYAICYLCGIASSHLSDDGLCPRCKKETDEVMYEVEEDGMKAFCDLSHPTIVDDLIFDDV
jgi:hypothetical protein